MRRPSSPATSRSTSSTPSRATSGSVQPIFVLSLAVVLLVLGVVLLVVGSVVGGLIAIVLAVCLLPTFLAGARRWPDTRIARAGISTRRPRA